MLATLNIKKNAPKWWKSHDYDVGDHTSTRD